MNKLGRRIVSDKAAIAAKRFRADALEKEAALLRREADEMERVLELAKTDHLRSMKSMGHSACDQPQ